MCDMAVVISSIGNRVDKLCVNGEVMGGESKLLLYEGDAGKGSVCEIESHIRRLRSGDACLLSFILIILFL